MRRGYRLATVVKPAQRRSRHGFNAAIARVKLRGFRAIDRRTAAARAALTFQRELIGALGGEADLSPQKRRLVEMATRAALLLDHVDAWLVEQKSLLNTRSRSLLPVVVQRLALADHLVRLLDKLGLDRVPRKVTDLGSYVHERYGAAREGRATPPATSRPSCGSVAGDDSAQGPMPYRTAP